MEQGWLGSVGITEIHVADGKHDGYVDVYVGVSFNYQGVSALEKHCKPKVKGLNSVAADSNREVVKFIARPKPEGGTLSNDELTKLAKSAIRSMKAWASSLDEHDVLNYTTGLSEAQIKAVMAAHGAPTGDIMG
jgi:hypothetical protein